MYNGLPLIQQEANKKHHPAVNATVITKTERSSWMIGEHPGPLPLLALVGVGLGVGVVPLRAIGVVHPSVQANYPIEQPWIQNQAPDAHHSKKRTSQHAPLLNRKPIR